MSKVLFITLSNIGDAILTLPCLDRLRQDYPDSQFTVICTPRSAQIFRDNPLIHKVIIYDKHSRLRDKWRLFKELRKEKFDRVVDLRDSLFGYLLPAGWAGIFRRAPGKIKHMKDRHLWKIRNPCLSGRQAKSEIRNPKQIPNPKSQNKSLYISSQDEAYIDRILKENGINQGDRIFVLAPGARSHIKRWAKERFAQLIGLLAAEFKAKIILAGDREDAPIADEIARKADSPVLNLAGKTSITQLACLLQKSTLVVTNDSAVLHLSSYLDLPVVAIFGPTNEEKYGPWSGRYAIAKKEIFCRPCEKAQCRFGTLECMQLVKVEDVLHRVRDLLNPKSEIRNPKQIPNPNFQIPNQYKRILIVRTDRIGDVLLSTPVIQALRQAYPWAYIAMMVAPVAKEIVEGNPYLDAVITYDKEAKHKSWYRSFKFARNLKNKKFDLALVLHPTNRAHLVTFLAGIPRRVGYSHKLGFLLTDRIAHTKQLGQKHEAQYSLDLLRHLGIQPQGVETFMPVKKEAQEWAQDLFSREGIGVKDELLAIHPGASCPSKIWPNARFAQVADALADKYGFKVVLVAGPKDMRLTQDLLKQMRNPALNLGGLTSVAQLASVLRRSRLLISNDSGPVHIASAVGTPVIAIFGRSQPGLGPRRWGPLGQRDKVVHRDVGCIRCLAHNCKKEFACLRSISAEDILAAAGEVLKGEAA
jgi:heptosyltransferase-2